MKKLNANGMKVLKLIHIVLALVWMTGALAMIVISLLTTAQTGDELYMKYVILMAVDNWLIIVTAISTLVVSIIYGIFTNWGFFKHRWIIVKWVITVVVILYGTFFYHPWLTENLELANTLRGNAFANSTFHANNVYMQYSGYAQLLLLLFAVAISVFKPWRKKKNQ